MPTQQFFSYHGKNGLIFNEMITRSALYQTNTLIQIFYNASSLKQKSADVAPLKTHYPDFEPTSLCSFLQIVNIWISHVISQVTNICDYLFIFQSTDYLISIFRLEKQVSIKFYRFSNLIVNSIFSRAFNIFQVYQYFSIYRWYFFLKFEHFI